MNEIYSKFDIEISIRDIFSELYNFNYQLSKEQRKLKNEKKLER